MKKGTTVAKKAVKAEALEPRIHIDEFLKLHSGLNEIRQSGFRALSKGKVWMRKSQWEQILKQYTEGV